MLLNGSAALWGIGHSSEFCIIPGHWCIILDPVQTPGGHFRPPSRWQPSETCHAASSQSTSLSTRLPCTSRACLWTYHGRWCQKPCWSQVDNIHCSPTICLAWFPFGEFMLTSPDHPLVFRMLWGGLQDELLSRDGGEADQPVVFRSSFLPFLKSGRRLLSSSPQAASSLRVQSCVELHINSTHFCLVVM